MDETRLKIRILGIALQANVPTVIESDPGEAKSSIMAEVFNSYRWPFKIVNGSYMDPTDVGGWPINDNGAIIRQAPKWAVDFSEKTLGEESAAIFLEELNLAPKAVQSAFMRVVHDREVGDMKLGVNVRRVAAINPPETSANGFLFDPPLANRFFHLKWKLTVDFWTQAMMANFPKIEAPSLPDFWETYVPQSQAIIAGFIMRKSNLMKAIPSDESQRSGPFPTPRSWTMAARLWAAADSIGAGEDVRLSLLEGCVGTGAAREYHTYRTSMDLPKPEDMLKDPKKVVWPKRGDQIYAALSSLVGYVAERGQPDIWVKSWSVMNHVAKTHQDVVVALAKPLAARRPAGVTKLPDNSEIEHMYNSVVLASRVKAEKAASK